MHNALTFFGQMAVNFRKTGAIAPSGKHLARTMARYVGTLSPGQVIVELGPGTGVFTRELVRRYPANPVIAIEFNPVFVKRLRLTLPNATIVEGCASRLGEHLDVLGIDHQNVAAVVSGLPLLALPKDLSQRIFAAVATVLPPGTRFIQFTYSARAWRRFNPEGFRPQPSRKVWFNFPPAVVLPFTRVA